MKKVIKTKNKMEPKFKNGAAVKLRDDVEYGENYNGLILYADYMTKGEKHTVKQVGAFGDAYQLLGKDFYVGEDALEAWPESTEETMSNEIDPQLFELVKAVTTGLVSNTNFTYIHNDEVVFSCKTAVDIAREIHRLLREEKL